MVEKMSSAAVTVQGISSPATTVPYKNPGDVDFEVKYPKDYEGPKHMPEGIVTVSKESAEQFTKLGIGKVANAEEVEANESKPKGGKANEAKSDTKDGKSK